MENAFNPDPNKHATDVLFSREKTIMIILNYLLTVTKFNNAHRRNQKHLGLFLDNKLDFKKHLDQKINKSHKIIGMMKKFSIGFKTKFINHL